MDLSTQINKVNFGNDVELFLKSDQIMFNNIERIDQIEVVTLDGKLLQKIAINHRKQICLNIKFNQKVLLILFSDKERKVFSRKIVL